MSKHTELIARLEAAEVGSRELDRLILSALGFVDISDHRDAVECWRTPDGKSHYATHSITTSLDAALALAERVLPDVQFNMATGVMGGLPWVQCYPFPQEEDNYLDAEAAATLPIALCIAILRALDANN